MPLDGPITLDIFDPQTYPTRRQEEWKYSDLSRALPQAPAKATQGTDVTEVSAGKRLTQFVVCANGGVSHETLRIRLAEGAEVTRIVILDEPEDAVSVRRLDVETAPNSVFRQYVFATGAALQRYETHITHAGEGAKVELHGAYLLKDKAHFDLTTRVTHAGPDGQTEQTIKGLVAGRATGVFQGRIRVERGADGTDARMKHQALILDDGAHIRAKPELEIYADDVSCAHGNTIGALDEAALFFCRSRGMDEPTARRLLTHAFVMPVADMIEDEEIRSKVIEFLETATEALHGL